MHVCQNPAESTKPQRKFSATAKFFPAVIAKPAKSQ